VALDENLIGGDYEHTEQTGEIALRFMSLQDPPTAVFASSDFMAANVLSSFCAQGIRVPGDVALVGYGDTKVADYLNLTSVSQRPVEMGRAACLRLIQRMSVPGLEIEEIIMPTELVLRRSTGDTSTANMQRR
jgi:DNA-binding LacI/PurR family transcriptional regulator